MTTQTETLIYEFCKKRAVHLLPSIFIGMQEEDNVSDLCEFKNCFKLLRNIAAHEPDTITTQIINERNSGCQKIILESKEEGRRQVVIDLVQFTAWMLSMYKQTKNTAYICFTSSFLWLLCPYSLRKYEIQGNCKYTAGDKPVSVNEKGIWVIREFLIIQILMYKTVGIPKSVHSNDEYLQEILDTDRRRFWKIAIPNMMEFVSFMFSTIADITKESNIELFLTIYREREIYI